MYGLGSFPALPGAGVCRTRGKVRAMDTRFLCVANGRQYYEVVRQGEQIFVGTRAECERFLRIHEEKVARAKADALREPRSRSVPVRVCRNARARA